MARRLRKRADGRRVRGLLAFCAHTRVQNVRHAHEFFRALETCDSSVMTSEIYACSPFVVR